MHGMRFTLIFLTAALATLALSCESFAQAPGRGQAPGGGELGPPQGGERGGFGERGGNGGRGGFGQRGSNGGRGGFDSFAENQKNQFGA